MPVPQIVGIVERVVNVFVSQIMRGIVEVVKVVPQERVSKKIVEKEMDAPVPQVLEQIDVPNSKPRPHFAANC